MKFILIFILLVSNYGLAQIPSLNNIIFMDTILLNSPSMLAILQNDNKNTEREYQSFLIDENSYDSSSVFNIEYCLNESDVYVYLSTTYFYCLLDKVDIINDIKGERIISLEELKKLVNKSIEVVTYKKNSKNEFICTERDENSKLCLLCKKKFLVFLVKGELLSECNGTNKYDLGLSNLYFKVAVAITWE